MEFKNNRIAWTKRYILFYLILSGLGIVLSTTPAFGALSIYYVEPFTPLLPENNITDELLETAYPDPLELNASQGETTSWAIIALRADKDYGLIDVGASEVSGADGSGGRWIDVRLIKILPRNNRYLRNLYRDRPEYQNSRMIPDILIYNEPLFEKQIKNLTQGKTLSVTQRESALAYLESGLTHYFLLTARVPDSVKAGLYNCSIVIQNQVKDDIRRIPVKINVLPFSLPLPGKMLGVGNDFGSSTSPYYHVALKDLADHGMNVTRIDASITGKTSKMMLNELNQYGFKTIIHRYEPSGKEQTAPVQSGIRHYFYGVDEPQPKKRRGRDSWDRMAEHVKLSHKIHTLGGKVVTSIRYPLAIELSIKNSLLYQTLNDVGVEGMFEPLDWASYGLGLQRIGRREYGKHQKSATDNQELWNYIARLQKDYDEGKINDKGVPLSKHNWVETYYFPLGFFKSPFWGRFLFGYFLFESHFDGVMAWTLYRPKGDPFTDTDGPDSIIAYPTPEAMASTYYWEALREGVNDLRYCRLAETLLLSMKGKSPQKMRIMSDRFRKILAPYQKIAVDGQRADRLLQTGTFRETREQLIELIKDLSDDSVKMMGDDT
ncbi:MAG: DUF4091 domain-containing protein [Desulfobacteraceae bacterium]|nr:hypothetical protein [Desulfobacteraceae bacterium]MBC2753935.1 DUF4091 domain-containing protein [Desulfobacteraceae bacterium]